MSCDGLRLYRADAVSGPVEVELAGGERTRAIPPGVEFGLPDGASAGWYYVAKPDLSYLSAAVYLEPGYLVTTPPPAGRGIYERDAA